MANQGEGASTVGVYIGPDFWNEYFGSNYTSQIPIVVWAAGSPYCPSDCSEAAKDFNDYYADMIIGGYKVLSFAPREYTKFLRHHTDKKPSKPE
ncbi:MAG: hypothetical protein M1415_02365 [Firmicutes bacterium]|nr:hypothetical protein [Bacillota bacterium]